MEFNKHIDEATDKDYLIQLDKFIDMDIANIGKDSQEIKVIKAKLFNTTIEAYEKKQLESFMAMKQRIKDRLNQLNNTNE